AGSVGEAYVCSAVNLVRILVVFKVAPYELPGEYFKKFTERALHFEIFFLTTGINSVLLQNMIQRGAGADTKVLTGIFFGLVLFYGIMGIWRSEYFTGYSFFGSQGVIGYEVFFLIFTRSSLGFGIDPSESEDRDHYSEDHHLEKDGTPQQDCREVFR
ncbi:hypothetical protein GJAV_G00048460, partial [Gymnothorax javanicus]